MLGELSLPAGTVTVLLTDIELPISGEEPQRVAIARVLELLNRATEEHNGLGPMAQGAGDGRVAVFAKASDAVAAALWTQRVLAEMRSMPRVRMAVHTGEAMSRVGRDGVRRNDVGPAILRAARLRACGHGGQVLVSGAAAELTADLLPDGASLVDLGLRRLRDLVRPERVFQLADPQLPAVFPPLRSLEELPNTLPTPLTSLVGREDELASLPAVLAGHRLVTLTGAGGVGKTRLAQQLAADLIDRHPGGTWWVELASVSTSAAVTVAVADGVRLALQPAMHAADQLAAQLGRAEPTMLVLDNCEHVLDTVRALVHRLLTACRSLWILTTSRELLGVPGEQVCRVASLACPTSGEHVALERLDAFAAATLFVDRARQARRNIAIDARSAPFVAAICARLDGIPLAIELAAARTRSLPVERVAAGLDDVFRLLTGGSQVAVPRQQTLLASISWSYELLDDVDSAVLRRLAICPSWFDVDAAEAIAQGAPIDTMDVLDSLARLVDKSLLEYDDTSGSYCALETIRQFALGRLTEAGELQAAKRRYAEHWAARTTEMGGGDDASPSATRAALTDIATMLEWAMTEDADMADRVLASATRGLFGLISWPELHRICDWLLVDRPRGPHWAGAVAQMSVPAAMMRRNDLLAAIDDALRLATEASDTVTIHTLRIGPSYVRLAEGDLSMVRSLLIDATAANDWYPAWAAVTALAAACANLGQLDELGAACRVGTQMLDAKSSSGFTVADCAIGPAQAVADHLAGDLDTPVLRVPAQRPAWEMFALMWAEVIGRVAVDRDDPALAERAAEMIDKPAGLGSHGHHALAIWAQQVMAGDLEGAAESAAAAVAGSPNVFAGVHALCTLAATLATLERWNETLTTLRRLDERLALISEPAPRIRAGGAATRARAALATGDIATAERAGHEALRTANDAELPLLQIDALEAVAAIALATDDGTRAARLLAAANAERRRRNYRGRFTSPIPLSACTQLATDHPAAWAEGATLTLGEATEFARRSRGPRGRPSFGVDALTPTERLIVDHVKRGHTNAEIAAELLITVPTVKTHLTRVYAKLGLRNRAELAAHIASQPRPAADPRRADSRDR